MSYPIKRDYSLRDFERSARFAGVPLKVPTNFPVPTQNAARVFWWLHDTDPDRARDWAHHCLRAYFARDVDPSQPANLRALADVHGVDAAAVALAWMLAKPGVIPLPGAKTGVQAANNAKALDVKLSDQEMAQLDAATEPWRIPE